MVEALVQERPFEDVPHPARTASASPAVATLTPVASLGGRAPPAGLVEIVYEDGFGKPHRALRAWMAGGT